MTGFGRSEESDGVRTLSAEIRSVNHRYSEISVRLPRRYAFAEDSVKKMVRERIARGKTDVYLSVVSEAEEDAAVLVNLAAARQYFKGFRRLQKELDLSGNITIELLASMPDVMKPVATEMDEESAVLILRRTVSAALDRFDAMRAREGKELAEDLTERIATIGGLIEEIEGRAPALTALYAAKLKDRITELLGGGHEAPEERIALEVAIFADKSNITEEIVRMRSHLAQFGEILGPKTPAGAVGKKLDFLVQEMNREVNTIGSKANDLKITSQMLEMKSEIEKIREQVQNIE
jgi:uncharacterized protein (TIGR00255 family)